jgi:hypothetical protein
LPTYLLPTSTLILSTDRECSQMFANETDRLIIFDDCGGMRLAKKDWNVKAFGSNRHVEQDSRFSIASAAVRKWLRKLEL